MFMTFIRILKFTWQDFWRNIWLTIITITVITLTLISISFLVVFNDLTATVVDNIKNKIDINISLKNTVDNDQAKQMRQYLEKIPEVSNVEYINKEKALEKFKEKHKDNEIIISSLEELGENPLGPSFIVRSDNLENYPNILNRINDYKNADIIADRNFEDYHTLISKFDSFTKKAKQVGLVLSIVFAVVTILIVFNTIRVSIYTHQEEIGIMKLVGATNIFIRSPYLLEGLIFTAISTFLTYLIFYPIVNVAHPYFWQYFEGTFNLQSYFFGPFIKILLIESAVIALINVVAAGIAVGRYLKK